MGTAQAEGQFAYPSPGRRSRALPRPGSGSTPGRGSSARTLLEDEDEYRSMSFAHNPYGDGAAHRAFVADFGTHFVSKAHMGGLALATAMHATLLGRLDQERLMPRSTCSRPDLLAMLRRVTG